VFGLRITHNTKQPSKLIEHSLTCSVQAVYICSKLDGIYRPLNKCNDCLTKPAHHHHWWRRPVTEQTFTMFILIPTLRQTKPREKPEAAICVRKSSARRVLQFTPLNAASCVLHRPANRVIHRLQSCFSLFSIIIHYHTKHILTSSPTINWLLRQYHHHSTPDDTN
jgi:hypothetical protein